MIINTFFPKISVIIPVYNVMHYINQCIDSVLQNNDSDFEVILIDDGSTDGSSDICDYYASCDSRVRVYHKKNGGVCSARNLGLDNATGEWIVFVDADDFVSEEYVKEIKKQLDKNCDLIRFQAKYHIDSSDNCVHENGDAIYINSINDFVAQVEYRGEIWCYAFKKSIIDKQNLRFSIGVRYAEDGEFTFKFVNKCRKFIYLPKRLYCYRQREGSAMSKKLNVSMLNDHLIVLKNLLEFTKTCTDKDYFNFDRSILSSQAEHYIRLVSLSSLGFIEKRRCIIELKEYVFASKIYFNSRLKNKLYSATLLVIYYMLKY